MPYFHRTLYTRRNAAFFQGSLPRVRRGRVHSPATGPRPTSLNSMPDPIPVCLGPHSCHSFSVVSCFQFVYSFSSPPSVPSGPSGPSGPLSRVQELNSEQKRCRSLWARFHTGDRQVPSLLAGEEGMFYFLKKENVQIIKMVQIANPHARYLGESLILTPAPSDTQITAH